MQSTQVYFARIRQMHFRRDPGIRKTTISGWAFQKLIFFGLSRNILKICMSFIKLGGVLSEAGKVHLECSNRDLVQRSGTFLANGAMKLTYFWLYFRESHRLFFNI